MAIMQEQYWTPKEVADRFKVSEETVRRYIRQKKLQAIRFGDQLRILDSSLQEFIKKRENNQPEQES
jgi:excisionase family DNA binding protein